MARNTVNNIRKSLAKARQKLRNTISRITEPLVKDGTIEVHYFTPGEDSRYIIGGVIKNYEFDNNKILIDHTANLESYNIRRGQFEAKINLYDPILGSAEYPMIYLKEISPDRRELRFEHVAVPDSEHSEHEGMLQDFVNNATTDQEYVVNFGRSQFFKIINQKIFEDHDLVIRLLDPLPIDIEEESTAWIVNELADTFNDTILLEASTLQDKYHELRGPNFELETSYGTITETDFKSWTTLLDANTSTSQEIIDNMFSGSLSGVKIGIDYSGLNNFIHFSSANERVANFKYKLELIEYYNSQIGKLNDASGSDVNALQNNVTINTNRKNDVIGSFDGFERWLYHEPTASLFTDHSLYKSQEYEVEGGRIGAQAYRIEPWPKFLSNGKYELYHTSASRSTSWYNSVYATASLYDIENEFSLIKTIPESIRRDENNSQYELFVNMIAHHYDIIYSYIDKLSKIYHTQEHPKLGHSKETLYEIAKSLGWSLSDGKQASALWQYKLGVNSGSGAYQSTGSLFSKSDEAITSEVWQRIVNNLPYLLKTKGTTRSIKALMNTYGIPQTLLSIREYGGPKVSGDVPTLIEDRFTYALQVNKNAHIKVPSTSNTIRTREIRFKPAIKDDMALMSYYNGSNTKFHIAVLYTGSYSGSDSYGRIAIADGAGNSTTSFLPLFDGEFWNLKWTTSVGDNNAVTVQKASDYITGKVIHSGSTGNIEEPIDGGSGEIFIGGKLGTSNVDTQINNLSDTNITAFSGSIQEYREWFETINDATFDLHTLNPSSYVSSLSPTASYDQLHRHLPLGTDLDAIDYSSNGTIVVSKHPASGSNTLHGGEATVNGFSTPINSERGNFEPVEETYYIQGISLGGNVPRSQKIRLEDSKLIRQLSPTNTAEQSRFDRSPLDTNRLGLFYSAADQINKEIFNQIGDVELDDYVGNPEDEFKSEYPNLNTFANEYWKKYTDRNDINAFIRIFSQFDFALFNQIKQLLPERVDEVSGLLVEPHALERVKVRITKQPTFTNPQYEAIVPEPSPTASGEYILNTATINITSNILSGQSIYHSGSNGYADSGNYRAQIQLMSTGSNSGSVNEGFVMAPRTSSIFKSVTYFYNNVESQSLGLYHSQSLSHAAYRDDEFTATTNQRFNGSRITGPGVNQASVYPQLNYKPIIEVFAVNPNQLIYNETPPPDGAGSLLVQ